MRPRTAMLFLTFIWAAATTADVTADEWKDPFDAGAPPSGAPKNSEREPPCFRANMDALESNAQRNPNLRANPRFQENYGKEKARYDQCVKAFRESEERNNALGATNLARARKIMSYVKNRDAVREACLQSGFNTIDQLAQGMSNPAKDYSSSFDSLDACFKRLVSEEKEARERAEKEAAIRDGTMPMPDEMRYSLAVRICAAEQFRKDFLAEISKQRKYSRLGGVIDMNEMNDLQQRVRAADEEREAAIADAKSYKKTRIPLCVDAKIRSAVACLHQDANCAEDVRATTKAAKPQTDYTGYVMGGR